MINESAKGFQQASLICKPSPQDYSVDQFLKKSPLFLKQHEIKWFLWLLL